MSDSRDSRARAQDATTELPCLDVPVEPGLPVKVLFAARTDTGLVRDHNEDDYIVVEEAGLYLVADGMGGHNAGSLASQICVETARDFYAESGDESEEQEAPPGPDRSLAEALVLANKNILDRSMADRDLAGMGTTAVGVRVVGNKLTISHAGDSRAYMFRDNELDRLTVDHSLSNFLRALGRDDEARMAEATMSNVIMRALGLEPDVEIETSFLYVEPGDRIMLCSDGLTDLVTDERIRRALMSQSMSREEIVDSLVEQALEAGGRDNVTVLLVDIVDPDAPERFEEDDVGGTLKMSPLDIEE